jgi:signal transduction histidine kinase
MSIGRDVTKAKEAETALRESEKQLRSFSSRLLQAEEEEKWRISRELHGELGQILSVMKLKMAVIERDLGSGQEALRGECQTLLKYLRQTIEYVRRLSRDLSPSILKDLGLTAAIRWLLRECGKHYNLDITLDITEDLSVRSKDDQIFIYRILQETLTNIGKHAQARRVSVDIGRKNDCFVFSVKDDGKGFDVDKVFRDPAHRGLGLTTMRERVRTLRGSFDIWSEEGKGTRIVFSVPSLGE